MFTFKNFIAVFICCAFPAILSAAPAAAPKEMDKLPPPAVPVAAPKEAGKPVPPPAVPVAAPKEVGKPVPPPAAKKEIGKPAMPKEVLVEPYKNWLTNMEAARVKAKRENKTILVALVGDSSWDRNSAALAEEVFNRKSVVETLSKEYVLVKIGFPKNSKDLTSEERREYTLFRRKYAPTESTPSVVLLIDRNGNVIGKIASDAGSIGRIKATGYLKMVNEASQVAGSKRLLRR